MDNHEPANMEKVFYTHYLERFKSTKNPAYLWQTIKICIENKLTMPEECSQYLTTVADTLLHEEHGKKTLPNILEKAMKFTHKRQLSEIRLREKHSDEHDKVLIYMEQEKSIKREAYDALGFSMQGSDDTCLIKKHNKATREVGEDCVLQFKEFSQEKNFGKLYEVAYIIGKKYISADKKLKTILDPIFSDIWGLTQKIDGQLRVASFANTEEELTNFQYEELDIILREAQKNAVILVEKWEVHMNVFPKIKDLRKLLTDFSEQNKNQS